MKKGITLLFMSILVISIPIILIAVRSQQTTQQHAQAPLPSPAMIVAQPTGQNEPPVSDAPTLSLPPSCYFDATQGVTNNGAFDPALVCPGRQPIQTYHCGYLIQSNGKAGSDYLSCQQGYTCRSRGPDGEDICLPQQFR
jgi:hypothetical protein